MVGVEQGDQHFKLVSADRVRQEADCIADAAFNGSQHFQRITHEVQPVSYTHLDVYKRQVLSGSSGSSDPMRMSGA